MRAKCFWLFALTDPHRLLVILAAKDAHEAAVVIRILGLLAFGARELRRIGDPVFSLIVDMSAVALAGRDDPSETSGLDESLDEFVLGVKLAIISGPKLS